RDPLPALRSPWSCMSNQPGISWRPADGPRQAYVAAAAGGIVLDDLLVKIEVHADLGPFHILVGTEDAIGVADVGRLNSQKRWAVGREGELLRVVAGKEPREQQPQVTGDIRAPRFQH